MKSKYRVIMAIILMSISFTFIIGCFSVKYILINDNVSTIQGYTMESILSDDGIKLYANINRSDSNKWVILVHSYRTDHKFMNQYAVEYQKKEYNTVQPDNRAHGQSEGKYIGMGYLDQYDILCWVRYILDIDPDAEIVLHGVSMGGATLMMLSGQPNLPGNIKCIIEDCGYTSATKYLTWKLKQRFHLPAFPIISIANVAFKISAGYYMDDASSIDGVKKSTVPILFIHGSEDTTVLVEEVYKLYEAASCKKELYIVNGAGHGEALSQDESAYWDHVFSFIHNA